MTNDGMPRTSVLVVILAALAATSSSRAQSDAGTAADAGPSADAGAPCDPACVEITDGGDVAHGSAVTFCDATQPDGGATTLDCVVDGKDAGVPGSTGCGDITGWGADCVLGEGADCDPGYAFGASRCDPAATNADGQHLFCVTGKCTFAATKPVAPGPPQPSAGTHIAPASTTNCLGCSNSSTAGAVMFGAALLSLRRLRRRG